MWWPASYIYVSDIHRLGGLGEIVNKLKVAASGCQRQPSYAGVQSHPYNQKSGCKAHLNIMLNRKVNALFKMNSSIHHHDLLAFCSVRRRRLLNK